MASHVTVGVTVTALSAFFTTLLPYSLFTTTSPQTVRLNGAWRMALLLSDHVLIFTYEFGRARNRRD